jgi:hypothetical protein
MDVDAGCNGDAAGELGSLALAPNGWKLSFNTHQAPATPGQDSYDESTMNQDIGFAEIDSAMESGAVVWLTSTPNIDEADSSITRYSPADDMQEQYLVGWSEAGQSRTMKLGRLSPDGTFLEGPVDVSTQTSWGRRDDPFRTHENGDVIWAWFENPGDTNLHISRIVSGGTAECQSF